MTSSPSLVGGAAMRAASIRPRRRSSSTSEELSPMISTRTPGYRSSTSVTSVALT